MIAYGNCSRYPLPQPNHSDIHSHSDMHRSHAHTCVHSSWKTMAAGPLPGLVLVSYLTLSL